MKYLDELSVLNLPIEKYAIFGSGPIAIRNLRESNDVDIIVKQDLWDLLISKYPTSLHNNPTCLKIGNIEIFKSWLTLSVGIDEMIGSAEIIEHFPFVQLRYVVEWKIKSGREKDTKDVKLIEEYNNHK
jgi:hypothetical protein